MERRCEDHKQDYTITINPVLRAWFAISTPCRETTVDSEGFTTGDFTLISSIRASFDWSLQ